MNKSSWNSSEDIEKVLEFNSECCVEELLPDLLQLNFKDENLARKTITSLGYLIVTYYCGQNYTELNKVLDWFDKLIPSCMQLPVEQNTYIHSCILYVCLDKANFLIEENDNQYAYSLINIVLNNTKDDKFSKRILKPLNSSEKTDHAYRLIEWSIQYAQCIEGDDENFYATGILEKAISFAENKLNPSEEDGIYFDRFWIMQGRVAWPNSTFDDVFSVIEPVCTPNNQIDKFPENEYEQTLIILKKMTEAIQSDSTYKHEFALLNRTMGIAMTRRVINFFHQSTETLLYHLKILKIKTLNGFINFISKIKHTGKLTHEKIKPYLYEYIQLLINDTKSTQTMRCDNIKWYLDAFRMTPNSLIQKEEFQGYSLLMLACQSPANLELLTMFVEHLEGDVNLVAETHYSGKITPLSVACEYKNLAAVKYLITEEADPNGCDVCRPALHLCLEEMHTTLIDFLLEQDHVDVNKDYLGKYPIHLAAKFADVRTVMKLVNRGALPDQESSLGETPLHLALMSQKDAKCTMVRYLLLVCKVRNNLLLKGESPLFMAARTGQAVAVEILLNKKEYNDSVVESGIYKGHTPLTIAIKECHELTVAILLHHFKLDANRLLKPSKMKKPISAFHFAQVCERIDNNPARKKIIEMLADNWILNHPEQVRDHIYELLNEKIYTELESWRNFILSQDSVDPETGDTVVHYLCRKKATTMLAWVLKVLKVNPDEPNLSGNTGLHIACRQRSLALLELLLAYPHNINRRNNQEWAPIDIALKKNSPACVQLLLDHGAIRSNNSPAIITKEIIEETTTIEKMLEVKMTDRDIVGKNPKKEIANHPTRISLKQVKTEQIKTKLAMNKQARAEKNTKPVKSPTTVANHPNALLTQKNKIVSPPELPVHEDTQWQQHEDNCPLHRITRAVEQTIFDIDRCLLSELNNHLLILANFFLPIQELRLQNLLTQQSPIVTQIILLHEEIKLKQGAAFTHTELQIWKNAVLSAYQEIIDQSNWMFNLGTNNEHWMSDSAFHVDNGS